MDWMTIEHVKLVGEAITGAILIWGFIMLFSKKVRKFFSGLLNAINSIEQIKKEVQTNGGTSLKDAMNRMERRILIIEHYRRLQISNSSYGVSTCDSTGHIQDMNRKFYEMCGLSRDQCMGMGWLLAIETHGERECVKIAISDCLNDKRETQVSFKLNGKMVTQHYFPIIDQNSQVVGLMMSTDFFVEKSA